MRARPRLVTLHGISGDVSRSKRELWAIHVEKSSFVPYEKDAVISPLRCSFTGWFQKEH